MFVPIAKHLRGMAADDVWDRAQPPSRVDLPAFSLSPLEYVTQIGEHLLTLPQKLDPFNQKPSIRLEPQHMVALLKRVAGGASLAAGAVDESAIVDALPAESGMQTLSWMWVIARGAAAALVTEVRHLIVIISHCVCVCV